MTDHNLPADASTLRPPSSLATGRAKVCILWSISLIAKYSANKLNSFGRFSGGFEH